MDSQDPKELTMNGGKINALSALLLLPLAGLAVVYYQLWHPAYDMNAFIEQLDPISVWGLPVLIAGIVAHELLHGITWAFFTSKGWRSIKFGFALKGLMPYCHSKEPLKAWQYRLGGLMPAVVLGFIPTLFAFLAGNLPVLVFGLFFTLAAGGDFIIVWLLRKTPADTLVADHPSKPGCCVYTPKTES